MTHVGEAGPVQLEDIAVLLFQGDVGNAVAACQVEGHPHGLIQVHEVDVHFARVWVVEHGGEEHHVVSGEGIPQQ